MCCEYNCTKLENDITVIMNHINVINICFNSECIHMGITRTVMHTKALFV